ncbi:MAG: 4-hydroxy-tetrahydrodipicolinate synthase [Eubacteriales bacterium]|nr:4-hydroxy-tetrahydrodipicolinate synthase [Eubacteriales bacterium]
MNTNTNMIDITGRLNNRRIPRGSLVALITPFTEDASVNYDRIRELVEWHIASGTDGIVALGTTGETPVLTEQERDRIVETIIQTAAGRIPVIVGSGCNNTAESREQSIRYEAMGADGLLVITPYYNRTNKTGMIMHFTEIADAVSIPIILYNVPGRTGCPISYEAVERLSHHPNIVGIKEASGDISLVSKIARLISDDFAMYSGNDDMIVPLLSLGGAGVISVLANILPRETHEMVAAFHGGNIERARDLQLHYLDFINALFIETNPIPIKEAMNATGMNVGAYRLPLYPMEDNTKAYLMGTMRQVGFSIGEVRGQTAK